MKKIITLCIMLALILTATGCSGQMTASSSLSSNQTSSVSGSSAAEENDGNNTNISSESQYTNSELASSDSIESSTLEDSNFIPSDSTSSNQPSSSQRPTSSKPQVGTQLFEDVKFEKGFGPGYIFGVKRDPLSLQRKDIIGLQTLPEPYKVYSIPDGVATVQNTKNKPWGFEEGPHTNFVDKFGNLVKVLYEHRLNVNNKILKNTANELTFVQYNNYGLAANDSKRDKKLVKKISTNKNGKINLYFNTGNDIRNTSYGYFPKFASDVWPHLLLVQSFENYLNFENYNTYNFEVTYKVQQMNKLSEWPSNDNSISGPKAPPEVNLFVHFLLRDKKDPNQNLWVGLTLYSTNRMYSEQLIADQFGIGIYRPALSECGRRPALNKENTVSFDLKKITSNAIKLAKESGNPLGNKKISDYNICSFNIGTETIGDWEEQFELSNISFLAN